MKSPIVWFLFLFSMLLRDVKATNPNCFEIKDMEAVKTNCSSGCSMQRNPSIAYLKYQCDSDLDAKELKNFPEITVLNISKLGKVDISVKNGNFSGNKISILVADHNNITTVNRTDFEKFQHLSRLNLSYNQIETLNGMEFASNNLLSYIDLRGNPLKIFSFKIFAPSVGQITVHLPSQSIEQVDAGCGATNCLLKSFKSEHTFKKLAYLNVSGNELAKIPNSLLNRMPVISEIDLSYNSFTSIDPMDFKGTPRLSKINYSHNKLSKLGSGSFSNLPHLKHMDLSNNRITSIDKALLKNNTEMQFLNLTNNPLKLFEFNIFSESIEKIEVHLPNDSLETVDIKCQKKRLYQSFEKNGKFDNLMHFNAFGNQLMTIPETIFVQMPNVQELNVSHNYIKTVDNANFPGLSNLKSLDLSNNQIESIKDGCFASNTKLRFLNLENNPITRYSIHILPPSSISDRAHVDLTWQNIEEMDLSRTSIKGLSREILLRLTALKHLNLNQAIIPSVEFDPFAYQRGLITLDLSYTHLRHMDRMLFYYSFEYMQTLNLQGNDLNSIDFVTPDKFPALENLLISNNSFDCDYLADFLGKWKEKQLTIGHMVGKEPNVNGVICNAQANCLKFVISTSVLLIIILTPIIIWAVFFTLFRYRIFIRKPRTSTKKTKPIDPDAIYHNEEKF